MRKHGSVTPQTRFYADWQELLSKEELDIAVICSINSEHAPMLKAAAKRKLHLISEKPLATSLRDLRAVRRAIEASGVRLTMLMTMRWTPCYRAVLDAIRKGLIGKPVLATTLKSYRLGNRPLWQRQKATFGGTIPFVNIHTVDLMRWTTGCEFVECQAVHGNAGKPEAGEMEDHAVVTFRMDNGGAAVSIQDYLRPGAAASHSELYFRVAGSDGVIEVVDNEGGAILTTSREPARRLELPPVEDYLGSFLDSLEGKGGHLIPAEDCYRLTEICLKAHDAAQTGKRVSLATGPRDAALVS
jgi:predicted dehydrogenase